MWNFKYFISPVSIDDKCHKKYGINKEKEDMECIIRNRTQNKKQIRGCSHNGCKRIFQDDYLVVERAIRSVCQTLCNPVDYSPPESSVHGIFQARILKWVVIPFSRGSSQPRVQTQVSLSAGGFFTSWAPRKALEYWSRLNTFAINVDSLHFRECLLSEMWLC